MAALKVPTLGVTGGIGSGKSTVCRLFEALGARVFYADHEAKRLMTEDPALRQAILDAFGPESYQPNGQLNRAYLAERVFDDPNALRRLNALVHPHVLHAFQEARKQATRAQVPLLILEAALLFESGADRLVDHVLVVDAPEAERIRRVVARDGIPPEKVRARMQHQLPPEILRARADFVLENTGSLEQLRQQVEALYRHLTMT
ncbi:dephospho-CoA kinase [Rhodothermus bifroesti]|uniref:Dephospho-CoA kinase n=1 Tax=Rhodothermus marinus TaxID=29549 RepID=A0A7V2B2E4_RHOMR|nr:dephospho-CoA kinase [Rhodothermus bifroesti]